MGSDGGVEVTFDCCTATRYLAGVPSDEFRVRGAKLVGFVPEKNGGINGNAVHDMAFSDCSSSGVRTLEAPWSFSLGLCRSLRLKLPPPSLVFVSGAFLSLINLLTLARKPSRESKSGWGRELSVDSGAYIADAA